MQALSIIQDAYERLNKLSPGEVLSAEDAAFGLRRLNLLVDELSAKQAFLYRETITSAAQTGDITLGAGAWAALAAGDEIISAAANNMPIAPLTMQQYNVLYQPVPTGLPANYAQDGYLTVYLYPRPSGETVRLQTRRGLSEFADQTTEYTLLSGWASALGAALAVRLAPIVLGSVPASLVRAESAAMGAIDKYMPAIVNAGSYQGRCGGVGGLAAVLYGTR